MKTFISIIITVALITTFTFTNLVLVTEGHVVAIEGGYTLINVNGEIFVVDNRPDITNQVVVVFYTPNPSPESWEIIYIKERH